MIECPSLFDGTWEQASKQQGTPPKLPAVKPVGLAPPQLLPSSKAVSKAVERAPPKLLPTSKAAESASPTLLQSNAVEGAEPSQPKIPPPAPEVRRSLEGINPPPPPVVKKQAPNVMPPPPPAARVVAEPKRPRGNRGGRNLEYWKGVYAGCKSTKACPEFALRLLHSNMCARKPKLLQ